MKLFSRKYGSGQPLIILHGLFGQSDNWNTLAKQFSENGLEVYTVDLRNHGLSPWSNEWNYKEMSEDILGLIEENNLEAVVLLGHSLGGKVAMRFALDHPGKLSQLIVVDIAPKEYPTERNVVIEGLNAVDLSKISSRKEAEAELSKFIDDPPVRQFLLKNLYWKEEGKLGWRFNLDVLTGNFDEVNKEIIGGPVNVPAVFIRGTLTGYVRDEDMPSIRKLFPNAMLITIEGAGHWVHADKPREFYEAVLRVLS